MAKTAYSPRGLKNAPAIAAEDVPPLSAHHPDTLPDIYAAKGRGKCLEPLIADGTLLVIDKTAPVENGDIVVIHLRPESVPAGEDGSLVKRLVMNCHVELPFVAAPNSEVIPIVIVEQINPHRHLVFKATELLAIHKCVGTATSRGNGFAAYDPAQRVEWAS